jgi:hypothetical protein
MRMDITAWVTGISRDITRPFLGSAVIGLALSTMLVLTAQAQEAGTAPTSADDVTRQLLQRVNELEAKVKQLEDKQASSVSPAVVSAPVAATAVPPAPEPPPSADLPTVNEVAPRLKMVVFGDVGAQGYTHVPDTFEFGSLDLFMRARLSDRVSVLGEVLFTAESDNSISPDVERLLLQYRRNDYFSASIGRYHTWVGYYNTAFNKGEFLETTTDRPFIYAFDDAGGVLPMQDVGVNVTGKIPSGKLGLNYIVEAGNGRDWYPAEEPAQNNQDRNNSKAINGGLFMRPDKFSGLQLGFSIRHDNLTVPGPPVGETIVTAHAVFVNNKWEVLNEGVFVRHSANGELADTSAFYTQWSRAFHNLRPYLRYQYFNAPTDDPVYINAGPNTYAPLNVMTFVGRLNGPSLGIRYDFTEHSALKVQYDRFDLRGLETENGLTGQVAFTF